MTCDLFLQAASPPLTFDVTHYQDDDTTAPPGQILHVLIASSLHDRSLNRSRSKFIWCAFCTFCFALPMLPHDIDPMDFIGR